MLTNPSTLLCRTVPGHPPEHCLSISILSDEFLAEVKGMTEWNLAVELLERLLKDEIKTRMRKNLVQSRSFREMLENAIRKYKNRAIESAKVIEELIALAKDIRKAEAEGAKFGFQKTSTHFTTPWK